MATLGSENTTPAPAPAADTGETGEAAATPSAGISVEELQGVLEASAATQRESQLAFIQFQTITQLQNLLFEALREALNQQETVIEAAFDELEKYRTNISSQQA